MDGWRWTTGESQMEPEARRSMAKISAAELVQSRFNVGFGPVTGQLKNTIIVWSVQ
jgi:hypothetical protein